VKEVAVVPPLSLQTAEAAQMARQVPAVFSEVFSEVTWYDREPEREVVGRIRKL
jgi:hypothetical protein